ncbi:MAG: AI-2E family transporter [Terracidiphilus sp.]
MARPSATRVLSQLLAVILAVVLIAVLYLAKTVIFPLALALLLTFILAPLVTWLERIRFPRILAVLCVIVAAGAILAVAGWMVSTQLIEVADDFPAYSLNLQNKIESFRQSKTTRFTRAQEELNRLTRQIEQLNTDERDRGPAGRQELGSSTTRPLLVREVGDTPSRLDTLSGVMGAMLSAVLVVVFTFFMLLNREDLRNRFIRLTGHGHLNLMTQAMDDASERVSRYLSLQLLVNTGFGTIIAFALQLLALPHAFLWGFLAGLLRFIPYVGEPIAAALPIALSVVVFGGWSKTLLIMAIFFCMEVVTANFIEPHVYGRYTGLSTLAILIAAIFWSLIWGPVGLVLSVPLTVCLAVVGSHVPSLEFLTVLLGDQPVMTPEAHYYQRLLASDAHEANRVLETYLKDHSLRELYDAVLIPALILAERDRHSNALDQTTVAFITQTTRDLVEEMTLREVGTEPTVPSENSTVPNFESPAATENSRRITVVPVRDDADEIIGIMLAQLLQEAGYSAKAIPIGTVEGMLVETFKSESDLVCLSALPPYAVSHARNLYRRLRMRDPHVKIIIGLWNYAEDTIRAAQEISGGETTQVSTSLAQATLQVNASLQRVLEQKVEETTSG